MICSMCGNNNSVGATTCSTCGAPLTGQPMVNGQVPGQQMMPQQQVFNQQVPQQQMVNQPVGQPMMNQGFNNPPGVGTLTIIRPNNFVGCLIPYDVYVDNYLLGTVPNGEQRTFQLYYGSHLVTIKQGLGTGNQQILINDETRNLMFNCPIKMGFVNNEIEFYLVGSSK